MKFVILFALCVALLGAVQAQLTVGLDVTRARVFHGWVGDGGPTPIDLSIDNSLGSSVFQDTVYVGGSSKWVYLGSISNYAFQNKQGFDLPYQSTDSRVATYVLYGSNTSNPYIDVFSDSTDQPPSGKARIRFSSTIGEDLTVVIGSSVDQLSSGANLKAYIEFDVDPGMIQISTQDNRFTSSHYVEADVTYRAIHVMQGQNNVVLFGATCDYSVTGRWNVVNLYTAMANVIRGGAGETTQTQVLPNSASKYHEYVPGNVQLDIQFTPQAQFSYLVNVFMAGFEEITFLIGMGLSLNIDNIPQPKNNTALVLFKNDWSFVSVSTDDGTILEPNMPVGFSPYFEIEPGRFSLFSFGPMTKISVSLEPNNVYLVAFNENNIVMMTMADTGAPAKLRYIHAAPACPKPISLFFSNTSSPIISDVAFGTASEYTSTVEWAGYYKYVVKDQDDKYLGAAAFRSEPNQTYSLITIGNCIANPPPKVFYWQDDNTLPQVGKARVKALHGAYDTPANPILKIDDTSLEQMTFGYFSSEYKEISGGMDHVLNVSFDSSRKFNKTVFVGDQSVSTVVTVGSWANNDKFDILVFTDASPVVVPTSEPLSEPVAVTPSKNNSPSKGSATSNATKNIFSVVMVFGAVLILMY